MRCVDGFVNYFCSHEWLKYLALAFRWRWDVRWNIFICKNKMKNLLVYALRYMNIEKLKTRVSGPISFISVGKHTICNGINGMLYSVHKSK